MTEDPPDFRRLMLEELVELTGRLILVGSTLLDISDSLATDGAGPFAESVGVIGSRVISESRALRDVLEPEVMAYTRWHAR